MSHPVPRTWRACRSPLEDVPDPEPGPGEVLVRVRACALNHLDLWQRSGLPRVSIPMPHISGSDVAGEVAASTVSEISVGQRVSCCSLA